MVNVYKEFGLSIPVLDDDSYLTTVNSVSSLFNAARFIWSGALDKIRFKFVYGFLVCIQLVLAFTITQTAKTKSAFGIVVCLTLFCIGGHFALFPNVVKQIFGKNATSLYGVMMTGTGLSSVMIVGLVLSPVGTHYYTMFYISGFLSALSMVCLLVLFKQTRFKPDWELIFHNEEEAL